MSTARKPTHCERVLELLGDGNAHNHHELYALGVIAHSRIADLRRRGYVIEQWRDTDARTSESLYWYQLVSEPVPAEQRATLLRAPAPSLLEDQGPIFASPGEGESATVASLPAAVVEGEGASPQSCLPPDPVQLSLEAA